MFQDARIIYVQLAGLAGAAVAQLVLVLAARACSRRYWPFAYLAVLLGAASALAWEALAPAPWLPWLVVGLGSAVGLRQLAREGLPSAAPWRQLGLAGWAALALLAVELLYAAFPAYRYDQWSYHLIVPKIIARDGPLPVPVLYDHIYFAGIYEYLLVVPRLFTVDDVVNHAFADAFTWLAFVVPLGGLLALAKARLTLAPPLAVLLAFAVFATPEHEAIFSAKPDALLLVAAFAALVAAALLAEAPWALSAALGFLLAGPVGLKITWLHFAVPAAFVLAWSWRRRRLPVAPRALALGLAYGVLVALPHLAKNIVFFHNPAHPSQLGPFHSAGWGPAFDAYWRPILGKADSPLAYAGIFARNLAVLPRRVSWFALPAAAALAFRLARHRAGGVPRPPLASPATPLLVIAGACFGGFVLVWPLLYNEAIFSRFVFPLFALALAACLALHAGLPRRAWPAWLLLLPLALNSSAEVKLKRMVERGGERRAAYFANHGKPLDQEVGDQVINADRRQQFPGAGFLNDIVLTDSPMAYFLDSQRLDLTSPDYLAIAPAPGCLWHFIDGLHIRYLRAYYRSFAQWPAELQPAIAAAAALSADPTILRLAPLVVQARRDAEVCPPGGWQPVLTGARR